MNLKEVVKDYVNACFTGLWIQTQEPTEAETEIQSLAESNNWTVLRWDIAEGWSSPGKPAADPGNPQVPLKVLRQATVPGSDSTTIMILHNYHRFLQNPVVMQDVFNTVMRGKTSRAFLVVLSPVVAIPSELEKVFVVIEHQLPDESAINTIAMDLCEGHSINGSAESVRAAAGLTRYEAEGAFALSLARHAKLQSEEIWELKESMLKKSGILQMHRGKEAFDELGGLEGLKSFCKKALNTKENNPTRPKGILLLGVPGTGKSAFAKALGNETNRPTLILDVGALFGSLVGQTEERIRQALKIADAMSPCVLFVDEIEKALSGTGGEGDGGVSTRLFGTLLTWLNDHTSDVFFVGTCNDVSKLPPEFSRAERFDGIFFMDLPSQDERLKIWDLWMPHFRIQDSTTRTVMVEDKNWTGAEIKACCRLAALLDVPITKAAKHIVPVAVTAATKVQSLREWASNRCLSANTGAIYHHEEQAIQTTKTRRAIKQKEN